jgi:hypothetical protein
MYLKKIKTDNFVYQYITKDFSKTKIKNKSIQKKNNAAKEVRTQANHMAIQLPNTDLLNLYLIES